MFCIGVCRTSANSQQSIGSLYCIGHELAHTYNIYKLIQITNTLQIINRARGP